MKDKIIRGPKWSVMERLRVKREKTARELEKIDKAIEVFQQYPETEEVLKHLSQVGIWA